MDAKTQTLFLRLIYHLHRGGTYGFWCYESVAYRPDRPDRPKERESLWWKCQEPSRLPSEQGEYGPRNVWFGVHPSYDIPEHNRAGDEIDSRYLRSQQHLISAINCLYAEFDGKDLGGKDMALEHVRSIKPHPSVMIDSGGGYHVYWLFELPWHLKNKESRLEARALQHGWVERVGGDIVSSNLNRVLRVPGYHNHKQAYAPDFPVVTFLECDMQRVYSQSVFRELVPLPERPTQSQRQRPKTVSMSEEDYLIWMTLGNSMSDPLGRGLEICRDASKRRPVRKPMRPIQKSRNTRRRRRK